MSNVEYDLDVSGGLMPQVQALIAPPMSEEASKNKKQEKVEHPYFKRPGKGHNHDSCDACSEGGDLICCDKCPASFHLTCHDPPLDEKDIPNGQWVCHHCRKTKELAAEKSPQARNKRSNSSTGSNSSSGGCPTKIKRPKPNPMEVLVKAASLLNPKQFELPRQLSTPCSFPGTDKVENLCTGRRGRGGGSSSSSGGSTKLSRNGKPYEFNGGLVPLPARTCFECRRSCRIGTLLACDYCPLLFHLDCLDPPLTALPAGRWMCPNHVEQYVDSKLVTSVSATERIRLWDKFSGPVDQDAVKTEFFRKVHCKNPPFRVKVRLAARKRVSVPAMVRHHYRNPVPLLPSLRDVLRLETVANRGREYLEYVAAIHAHATDIDSMDKMNGQMAELMCNGQANSTRPPVETGGGGGGGNQCAMPMSVSVTVNGMLKQEVKNEPSSVVNGTCNGTAPSQKDSAATKLPDVVSGLVLHSDIERELKQLDDRLIRLLAYQRIQHLLSQHDGPGPQSVSTLVANSLQGYQLQQQQQQQRAGRHMPLPSELLTAADIDRISRVFTSPKRARTRSRSSLRVRAMLCPVVSKHFYNVRTSEVDQANVRHDASFMGFRPTVSARFPEAAAMRYRSLTIGRGSANDVELERFGHCNYTSPKHAVIFYDECTRHYELINYSEYGTQVNNVLYSCDLSDKASNRRPPEETRPPNILASVREIVDKKRKAQRSRKDLFDARMTAVADGCENLTCSCGNVPPAVAAAAAAANDPEAAASAAGWEGAAVLGHGALLRFGCIAFVFSVVECATV